MNNKKLWMHVFGFTLILLLLLLSGCGSGQFLGPTAASVSTIIPTSASTSTPTLTPTLTPTSTPIPTPTLPFEIPSPATGTGTVIGLVLWNGEPVVKDLVNLCESYDAYTGCYGKRYPATTNSQGYYLLENVNPGRYIVNINMFSAGWYHLVDGSGSPMYDIVKADEITIIDPLNIYKIDLKTTYPHGSLDIVIYETQPTLKWNEYPHADYYIVEMNDSGLLKGCGPVSTGNLESPKIENGQTSFLVPQPLEIGTQYLHYWCVNAYNKTGIKIAEGLGAPFYVLNP